MITNKALHDMDDIEDIIAELDDAVSSQDLMRLIPALSSFLLRTRIDLSSMVNRSTYESIFERYISDRLAEYPKMEREEVIEHLKTLFRGEDKVINQLSERREMMELLTTLHVMKYRMNKK